MIGLILRLFDLLSPLVRALGVDYVQFRAIVETRLLLDARRRNMGLQSSGEGKSKKAGNAFAGTLVFYVFMGGMVSIAVVHGSPAAGAAVLHAFVMVMVGLSLISDFSSVLLDTTDNAILQPRPVTGRTALVARVAHIVVYLAALSLSLSLAPMIAGAWAVHPWYPPVYLATLAGSVALVLFLASLLYLAAMRLFNGERLRDAILYVQIGMTVLMIGGYQLLPRLMDMTLLTAWRLEDHPWSWAFPPVWFAAPMDLLAGRVGAVQIGLTALAVCVPAAGLLAVVFVFAPRFNRALLELDSDPSKNPRRSDGARALPPRAGGAPPRGPTQTARATTPGSRLGRLLCRQPEERAAFELVWLICGRDRQFKFRTYPSLAVVLVVSVSVLLSAGNRQGLAATLAELPNTRWHLYLLYMACMMIPTALLQLRYSPHYQAAWVFEALPVSTPGRIMAAALKAVLARFVVPAYLLVSVPVAAIWGLPGGWDILFAFCAVLFMSALEGALLLRTLPFSEAFGAIEGSSRVRQTLVLMAIPGLIGLFHYALGDRRWLLLAVMALLLTLAWLLGRRYARTDWSRLRTG